MAASMGRAITRGLNLDQELKGWGQTTSRQSRNRFGVCFQEVDWTQTWLVSTHSKPMLVIHVQLVRKVGVRLRGGNRVFALNPTELARGWRFTRTGRPTSGGRQPPRSSCHQEIRHARRHALYKVQARALGDTHTLQSSVKFAVPILEPTP